MAPTVAQELWGLTFPNPFVLPSAQAARTGDMILRAMEAGWGGCVTQTFTSDATGIRNVAPRISSHRVAGEVVGLVNIELVSPRPADAWFLDIARVKNEFPERPLIASITAFGGRGDWQELARSSVEAGADALELNISTPHGLTERGGGATIGRDALAATEVTRWVVEAADVPVWVKLAPDAPIGAVARAVSSAGCSAVTATNNPSAFAGVDVESVEPRLSVDGATSIGGYAGAGIKPITLRCVLEAAQTGAPTIACGAIEDWRDAVEFILLGALLLQPYTPVLTKGYPLIAELVEGVERYMDRHGHAVLDDLRGAALPKVVAHSELSRGKAPVAVVDEARCTRCGGCRTACEDGGYQAISLTGGGVPEIDPARCTGCGLCVAICAPEALGLGSR